jgi:hypothetical protein
MSSAFIEFLLGASLAVYLFQMRATATTANTIKVPALTISIRAGRSVNMAMGRLMMVMKRVAHMGVPYFWLALPKRGRKRWVRLTEHTIRATPIIPTCRHTSERREVKQEQHSQHPNVRKDNYRL